MPETPPPIVKTHQHIIIPKSYNAKNTDIYLNPGDFYSIFVDHYTKRPYLYTKVGEKMSPGPDRFISNPKMSGYLYLGSYSHETAVDVIVWREEHYDQIVRFLKQMQADDPDNEEINDFLQRAKQLLAVQLASEKATKEIEETKKILQKLKKLPQKEVQATAKAAAEEKPKSDAKASTAAQQAVETALKEKFALETKPFQVGAGKKEGFSQLEAKMAKLAQTLAQLEQLKKHLAQEKQKTSQLSERLAVKEKKEKDLLVKLKESSQKPPVVVIASPEDNSQVEANTILLSGVAEDDAGINRLDIFVNNRLIKKKTERGIKVAQKQQPQRLDFNRRIPLEKGTNRIKISAVNAHGLSTEKVLTVHKLKIRRNVWAAVIGINNYPNVRPLRYAVADARAFYDHLIHHSRIPAENVTLLIDQEANLTRLRSTLGTHLKSKAGRDDMVIIFFAGHGATEKDLMSPDGDGLEKYLLPYDVDPKDLYATALPMGEISRIFGRIQAERLIFIADSCYSGASGGRTLNSAGIRANISEAFLDRIAAGKGRVILTASSANEVSTEDEKLQHGIFTYFLLEGLRGKADIDRDGLITVDEAYDYVSLHVPRATGQEQHPVKKGIVEGRLILGTMP